jgi:DNA-directed RNA polymerase specialized sigma24 family protein
LPYFLFSGVTFPVNSRFTDTKMNQQEYQQIVRNHADALYRFSLKNIKVIEEAKEIVQNSCEFYYF